MNHASRFHKYWLLPLTVLLMFGVLGSNCQTSSTGTMTGNDGKTYKTVQIGNQVWLAENLRETKYRDGTLIPVVTDGYQWAGLKTGARCVYDNDDSNAKTYGYLYNWYAVVGSRSLAPAGWRVPTDNDWKQLEIYLGMTQPQANSTGWRGSPAGNKLKGNASLWASGHLKSRSEFGRSGFTALPGGYRGHSHGYFHHLGNVAYFWSATGYSTDDAWDRLLYYDDSGVSRGYGGSKQCGFSVRLIRD